MRKKILLSTGVASGALMLSLASEATAAEPVTTQTPQGTQPNVVFIYADDLGIADVGCYGGGIKTPNIDALAASGMRFTRCWAAPLCLPSRAMVLTGRYGFRTGLTGNCCKRNLQTVTPQSEITFAAVVKTAGYKAGAFGKWAQIYCEGDTDVIPQWGWEGFCTTKTGHYYAATHHPLHTDLSVDPVMKQVGDKALRFQVDMIQNACLSWMSKQVEDQKPFVVYYPHLAPHKGGVDPAFGLPPKATHPPMPITKAGVTDNQTLHKDTVRYLDLQVGAVMDHLRKLGIERNTLVIFTSDNGGLTKQTVHGRLTYDNGYTGRKGNLKDSMVPFVASWPGVIKPGQVTDALTDLSDILPTIADVAQADLPKDRPIDGVSLLPLLRGETKVHREWIMNMMGNKWAIRNDGYELLGSTDQNGKTKPSTFLRYEEEPYTADRKVSRTTGEGKENFEQLKGVIERLAEESPWRFQCPHRTELGKTGPLKEPKDKFKK